MARLLILIIAGMIGTAAEAKSCREYQQEAGDEIERLLKDDTQKRTTVASSYADSLSIWQSFARKKTANRLSAEDAAAFDHSFERKMDPEHEGSVPRSLRTAFEEVQILAQTLDLLKSRPKAKTDSQLAPILHQFKIGSDPAFARDLNRAFKDDDGTGKQVIEFISLQIRLLQGGLSGRALKILNVSLDSRPTKTMNFAQKTETLPKADQLTAQHEYTDFLGEGNRIAEKASLALNDLARNLDELRTHAQNDNCPPDATLVQQLKNLAPLHQQIETKAAQRPATGT